MDRLTRTPFFELAISNTFLDIDNHYLNFVASTYDFCRNGNRLQLFFTLSYTLTELRAASANAHVTKAILLLEQTIEFIKSNPNIFKQQPDSSPSPYVWTSKSVHLVELVYAITEARCVNNGDVGIEELIHHFGAMFNIEIKDGFGAYGDIKRRKGNGLNGDSRTYFLDQLRTQLNQRMERDDQK